MTFNKLFLINRTKYNLNSISHDSAIGLIEKLTASGVNIVEVCMVLWSLRMLML